MTLRIWSRILWGLLRVFEKAIAYITELYEVNVVNIVNDVNYEINFVNDEYFMNLYFEDFGMLGRPRCQGSRNYRGPRIARS